MLRKRLVRRLAIVLLLVAVLLLGIMTAAVTTDDRFYASRIVAWRDADFRDFERFPSRPVPAGPNGFSFEPAPENPPEYPQGRTGSLSSPPPRTRQST